MLKKTTFENKASEIRKSLLNIAFKGNGSHISSSLSIVDILTVLYFDVMNVDPKNPLNPKRDKFILSKGHAVSALYATLAKRGFFPEKLLDTYGKEGTYFGAHPDFGIIKGIELSTGSLGHGLSVGCGMALASKLNNYNSKVFVIISDGECQEGSVWESAIFAGNNGLDNIVVIVDYNKFQAFGRTKDVSDLEPLKKKWQSFGWGVIEVDGHNLSLLKKTLKKIPLSKNKPTAIIAHTVAGKGVSFMEDKLEWHYLNLTEAQHQEAIAQLDS